MRNNLDYYSHDVNSHHHWKFKALRRVYGWEGEGKFWALNNMIAASENCSLDLSNDVKHMAIAAELDFSVEEFKKFLDFLVNESRLVVDVYRNYTTEKVQENFKKVDSDRERKREWKNKKSTSTLPESTSTNKKSTSTLPESTSTLHKGKESKVKESKVNNIRVSKDTLGNELPEPEIEDKKALLKNLKGEYEQMEKSKVNICDFIKNQSPMFVEPYAEVWNLFAFEFKLPQVTVPLTTKREKQLLVRLKEKKFNFLNILSHVKNMEYLLTANWFSFDWITKNETNYLKIIEGNYKQKQEQQNKSPGNSVGSEIKKARETNIV